MNSNGIRKEDLSHRHSVIPRTSHAPWPALSFRDLSYPASVSPARNGRGRTGVNDPGGRQGPGPAPHLIHALRGAWRRPAAAQKCEGSDMPVRVGVIPPRMVYAVYVCTD